MALDAWSRPAREGRLEEALKLALEAREQFPERSDWTWFPVAAVQARLGRQADAAATLRDALERDHLWRISLLNAIELDLSLPDVAAVVSEAQARIERLHLEPRLLVETPSGATGIRPVLLAFHGATGNAELEMDAWRPATELGYVVAAAQSSQPSLMGGLPPIPVAGAGPAAGPPRPTGFCWDPPDERIDQDLNQIFGRLPRHARLVLAGFSQGAWLALHLALEGARLPAAGVVMMAPFVGDLDRLPPTARRLRVAVLAGSDDSHTARVPELAERLARRGHHVEMHVVDGLGHAYPDDFAGRLPTLLAAVRRAPST